MKVTSLPCKLRLQDLSANRGWMWLVTWERETEEAMAGRARRA